MAAIVEEKPTLPASIREKVPDSALKSLVESYIDEQIEFVVRPLKNQVKSVLNSMEIMQSSLDLSMKQINMRINALSGHVEKKKKDDGTLSPPMTYEEALDYKNWLAEKIKKESSTGQPPGQKVTSGHGKRF